MGMVELEEFEKLEIEMLATDFLRFKRMLLVSLEAALASIVGHGFAWKIYPEGLDDCIAWAIIVAYSWYKTHKRVVDYQLDIEAKKDELREKIDKKFKEKYDEYVKKMNNGDEESRDLEKECEELIDLENALRVIGRKSRSRKKD